MYFRHPALLLTLVLLVTGCGSAATNPNTAATPTPVFAGGEFTPPRPEPSLALRDYHGTPVDIAQFRGKAVLVAFVRSHCTDVCPLIVATERQALDRLGLDASKVELIAVSTDPLGDTPASIDEFLTLQRMNGRLHYLVGALAELTPIWKHWYIAVTPDPNDPTSVDHSFTVYGVSAVGRLMTFYPGNLTTAELTHDLPLLAAR